ncbi:MAG: 1-deoxy-D-xylulose-5-phosphate reductoisomerase [bacterium]|nr:1-deoxy-D-xylulose-5-phosphate reductoisomerase [bacterium]MDE0288987.1 1-deoxy-D-xylulose-5-phosphate reductoisomerase [bacterium]MDE0439911.1 1-deoxy-D-xylulose-5-phosphate reductoisomerase [bacterium]
MRSVVVLGATGSVGRQTLEVADRLGFSVEGLAARRAGRELEELATRYERAAIVAVEPDEAGHARYRDRFGKRYGWGMGALAELAARPGCTVVNGVVGAAGLEASIVSLQAGNRLALANKESLVVGGPLVVAAAESGELIPVDSEHSALFQCIHGEAIPEVSRLLLTASGGPFRGRNVTDLARVGVDEALAHPTWRMGPRITIDSATLVNKGLEVIEAHFLFGLPFDRVDVVVHPQSIVHSLVEFVDGSLKAHLGVTDMRIPIQYALTYPARADGVVPRFDITRTALTFEPVDRVAFPALDLAYAAGRGGGTLPAAFNAADEVAVEAFLRSRIGFLDIAGVIAEVMEDHDAVDVASIDAVRQADRDARRSAAAAVARR